MYRISSDKRVQKSADLIWDGMKQCLQEKSFDKLRINDINQKTYISRATFYRLFDSLQDVLVYECDKIYNQLAEKLEEESDSKREIFILLIEKWMAQDILIKTLVENNMTGIIYDTHMKNCDVMKKIFLKDTLMTEYEQDFMVSLLANIIPAVMTTWYQHGKSESAMEIYHIVSRSLNMISEQLF